jgi:hypothetical protein
MVRSSPSRITSTQTPPFRAQTECSSLTVSFLPAVATLAIPLAIFDQDVRPSQGCSALAALVAGVTVKKFATDVGKEADPSSSPAPKDPRLA